MRPVIDLSGQRFGLLTVRSVTLAPGQNRNRSTWWWCECACGGGVAARSDQLRSGGKTFCVQWRHPDMGRRRCDPMIPRNRHPMTYRYWESLCQQGKITEPDRWGRWDNFLHDMGERPSMEHVIRRRSRLLGYDYSNCFWTLKPRRKSEEIGNGDRSCGPDVRQAG